MIELVKQKRNKKWLNFDNFICLIQFYMKYWIKLSEDDITFQDQSVQFLDDWNTYEVFVFSTVMSISFFDCKNLLIWHPFCFYQQKEMTVFIKF